MSSLGDFKFDFSEHQEILYSFFICMLLKLVPAAELQDLLNEWPQKSMYYHATCCFSLHINALHKLCNLTVVSYAYLGKFH